VSGGGRSGGESALCALRQEGGYHTSLPAVSGWISDSGCKIATRGGAVRNCITSTTKQISLGEYSTSFSVVCEIDHCFFFFFFLEAGGG
jgi:hypothetical protein